MQHSPLLSFWKLSSILALTSRSYGEKAPASFTDHIGNVRGSSQGRARARQQLSAPAARVQGEAYEVARNAHRPLFSPWPPLSCTLFHTI